MWPMSSTSSFVCVALKHRVVTLFFFFAFFFCITNQSKPRKEHTHTQNSIKNSTKNKSGQKTSNNKKIDCNKWNVPVGEQPEKEMKKYRKGKDLANYWNQNPRIKKKPKLVYFGMHAVCESITPGNNEKKQQNNNNNNNNNDYNLNVVCVGDTIIPTPIQ